jgi:hypothetical protein
MEDDSHAYLKQYRLAPETREKLAAASQKARKSRQPFVMVPWKWVERLAETSSANVYRVALHLLHRHRWWLDGM